MSGMQSRGWVGLVLALSAWGLSPTSGFEGEPRTPRSVGSATPIVVPQSRVKAIDTAVLAASRPGILAFVQPIEGDTVAAQQEVVGLKDEVAAAQLAVTSKQATNDVEIRYAKKAAEVAEAEYQKAIYTNKRLPGAITPIEVDRLKLAWEKAVLSIEQAQHQFDLDGLKRDESLEILKTHRIQAPFNGVVTKVMKQVGEAVRDGDPVLEVVNTSRMRVEGYVHLKSVFSIRPGAKVNVQLDIRDVDLDVEKEVFEGRIVFVDVKVNPVSEEVRVWAEVANRENLLRDGLMAKMTIFPDQIVAPPPQTAEKKAAVPPNP